MVVPICPRCGAIMTLKVVKGVSIAVCTVCGYQEQFSGKLYLEGITPPDFEAESNIGQGIMVHSDKKPIKISEDEQRELFNVLAGETES